MIDKVRGGLRHVPAIAGRANPAPLARERDDKPLAAARDGTEVGAFSGSGSFYATFDQCGELENWNDLDGTPNSLRGLRGGNGGDYNPLYISSSFRFDDVDTDHQALIGFRLAAPAAVPEPSTCAMALAGVACGGYLVRRRRKQA